MFRSNLRVENGHIPIGILFIATLAIVSFLQCAAGVAHAKPIGDDAGGEPGAEQGSPVPPDGQKPKYTTPIQDLLGRIASAVEAEKDKPEPAEERDRAQRDLAAQENMALWAMAMFWTAAAQVALGFLGVFLIWRTLVHTRRAADAAHGAVDEARKATAAADETVKQAVEANRIAESNFINDSRPWLDFTITIIGPPKNIAMVGILFPAVVEITNYGRTPAINTNFRIHAWPNNSHVMMPQFDERAAHIDAIYSRIADNSSGAPVFPGQTVTRRSNIGINPIEWDAAANKVPGVKGIGVTIFGIARMYYKFAGRSAVTEKYITLNCIGDDGAATYFSHPLEAVPANRMQLLQDAVGSVT